jgi:hypothetical protein
VSSLQRAQATTVDFRIDDKRDPLLRCVELPHVELYHPFGFPLRVSSNSPEILEAASQSFGHFQRQSDGFPIELDVTIAGSSDGPPPVQPTLRTRRQVLTLVSDSDHLGSCDFEAGYGSLWLSPRALRDRLALRFLFLETFGFCMLCDRHLAPVHAACVESKGSAVLLCGQSTAGKSTLAYACARRGFTYVSDDGCYLIRKSSDRIVVGNSQSIRFRPSAAELFPELMEHTPVLRANGKLSIELSTRKLGLATSDRCRVDHLVFLNRQASGPPHLRPFPRERARAELNGSMAYGRESAIAEQRAALDRLMDLEIQELTYSDLDSAVDLLELLLTNRERQATWSA